MNQKKLLIKNFSFLSILQFSQMLIGFLLFPYLLKTLGKDKYGTIIYGQAIVGYLLIVLNYGFNLTATKQIANNKRDNVGTLKIISSVYFSKMILFSFITITYLIILFCVPFLYEYKWVYIFSYFSLLGWLLYPEWYFQGIEKMENITYAMLIAKLLSIIFILFFIKEPKDFRYVPIINSLSIIIAGAVGFFLMKRSFRKNVFQLSFNFLDVKKQFYEGYPIFLSNVAANTKDYLNTFLIGAFFTYGSVAIYDLCNKIVRVLIIPVSILYRVTFPRVTITKSLDMIRKVEKLSLLYTAFVLIVVFTLPDYIILYLVGIDDIEHFKIILRILSISIPLLVLTGSRGMLRLIAFDKDKLFTKGIFLSITIYFLLIVVLYLSNSISEINLLLCLIIAIVIELTSHIYHNNTLLKND